ncbi:MAG: sulfotransferase [Microbacterium sp.]|uniref:sulfotransferase n=1 Tax=Microbacterium sp. TaxID=51671 RepID=UPI0039E578D7
MTGLDVMMVLGTDHHPFNRAVAWADKWARRNPDQKVLVQYGSAKPPEHAEGVDYLSPADLAARMAEAAVVITHGGPGTISAARAAGHYPIVVPRDPRHGEHVDDHQLRFSRWAESHGLVSRCEDIAELDDFVHPQSGGTRLQRGSHSGEGSAVKSTVRMFESTVEANRDRRRPLAPVGPVVLYIGGFGRSGSTLVERAVTAIPNAVSLGEVVHLWRRGLIEDELCGCGTPFSQCAFWIAVGEQAFGGWSAVDPEEVLALHQAVDRQRRVLRTLRPRSVAARDEILRYTSFYRAVYDAAAKVSGADIVVDSSKHASLALALSNDRRVDLRILHLVRDSVAVAYSWSKEVSRPETGERAASMARYSSASASALWASNNLLIQLTRAVGAQVHRMRYEDFVRAPTETLRRAWDALELPGVYDVDLSARDGVELETGHSIGGNPMRFQLGPVIIRPDEAWREAMPDRQRRTVKLLTAPVRAWLGYTDS